MLGIAFKELKVPREEIVVSTKLFYSGIYVTGIAALNSKGLSRKKIIESAKLSLKRLQLDYVDVIYAHRPDLDTPLEETCRAYDWIINQGWAFYWGTSEWTAARITEAIELCHKLNLHAPIVEQPQYNMFIRDRFEVEYRALYERYGYGTTIWGPLCGGILSGRYNDGNIPTDGRYANDTIISKMVIPKYFGATKDKTVQKL